MNGASRKKLVQPVRGLIIGWPKAGKTPAIASLLNVGYKVRMLNLQGANCQSLLEWTDERALKNLDILDFDDPQTMGARWMEPLGDPKAFNEMLKAMKEWKGKDERGKEYSLGRSSEWGPDTVVVLDSLTKQGEASYNRVMKLLNRTPGTFQIKDWGFVTNDQVQMLRLMARADRKYHFLVIGHLQVISPETIMKDEEETNKQIKRELGELLSARLFPRAVTKNLSQTIAKEFPMVLQVKKEDTGKRYIYTQGGEELDLACPVKGVKAKYDLTTGLADIFEAWGHKAPGFGKTTR